MQGSRHDSSSDERISRFAARYGGLLIFYRVAAGSHGNNTVHTEHCAIWRYFAGVMRSLLRIGAEQYQGRAGLTEDWELISKPPGRMGEAVVYAETRLLDPGPLGDEEKLASAVALCSQGIAKCAPQYTLEAKRAGIEGTVVLYIQVNLDGNAQNVKVQRSLDSGLDAKAIEAVKQWRFSPGTKYGKPVVVPATIEVKFRLNDTAEPCRAARPQTAPKPQNGRA